MSSAKKIFWSVGFFFFLPFLKAQECRDIFEPYFIETQNRCDSIALDAEDCTSDEYLSGYLQALVDMHYYEFQVKVVVQGGCAYVSCLPKNAVLAESILSFIQDVPGICGVELLCEDSECCSGGECSDIDKLGEPLREILACANNTSPCDRISGIWLPQSTVLFAPLIADPRQVTNSAALRFNDSVIGKHVGAVSFGDDFGIYRWRDIFYFHGDLEFDIEAGIFAVFDLDHTSACMVNTDFFVAAMFSYAFDCWSFRFRLWHLSSHLGDEFLLAHPGFDRRNLSDEGVDLFASYQMNRYLRLYAGIGDIVARDKSFPEQPIYFEGGAEIKAYGCRDNFNRLYLQPFFAMHFRSWQEHDFGLDQTYALGMEWSKIQGVGKRFRLFLEYHTGFCKEGQFVKKRSSYSAIKATYGF